MLKGLIYEFEHVFVNSDPFFFILTYVAIFIGAIVGPGMAMALYGGSLEDGEKAKPWMQPIINLSTRVNAKRGFDNSAWANSGLSNALKERLYFDKWYGRSIADALFAKDNKPYIQPLRGAGLLFFRFSAWCIRRTKEGLGKPCS